MAFSAMNNIQPPMAHFIIPVEDEDTVAAAACRVAVADASDAIEEIMITVLDCLID